MNVEYFSPITSSMLMDWEMLDRETNQLVWDNRPHREKIDLSLVWEAIKTTPCMLRRHVWLDARINALNVLHVYGMCFMSSLMVHAGVPVDEYYRTVCDKNAGGDGTLDGVIAALDQRWGNKLRDMYGSAFTRDVISTVVGKFDDEDAGTEEAVILDIFHYLSRVARTGV